MSDIENSELKRLISSMIIEHNTELIQAISMLTTEIENHRKAMNTRIESVEDVLARVEDRIINANWKSGTSADLKTKKQSK